MDQIERERLLVYISSLYALILKDDNIKRAKAVELIIAMTKTIWLKKGIELNTDEILEIHNCIIKINGELSLLIKDRENIFKQVNDMLDNGI